jgi:beta-phosphoglucomutase-like phosphatase (HAD superfamily)
MKQVIVLDFDGVLFNTAALKEGLFLSIEGADPEICRAAYVELRKTGDFTISRYAEAIASRELAEFSTLEKNMNLLFKKDYVFSDARAYIEALKHIDQEIWIVTRAERVWQEKKIASTGLAEIVDKIIVTQKLKSEELIAHNVTPSMIIEDSEEELNDYVKHFPASRRIFITRDGKNSKPASATEVVKSLDQIKL